MEWSHHLGLVFWLSCVSLVACSMEAKYEHHEEWKNWKLTHGTTYLSEKEEIEKHILWLSNKEYIDQHNANSHIFGYTLALNQFGDMVCS